MKTPLVAIVGALLVATAFAESSPRAIRALDAAGPTPGGERVVFDPAGDTVQVPDGWQRAELPLAPALLDPHEILAISTFPIPGPNEASDAVCVGDAPPGTALQSMAAKDALIWIVEWEGAASTTTSRPSRFTQDDLNRRSCVHEAYPQLRSRSLLFTSRGRVFDVFVVLGEQASRQSQRDIYRTLDSLRFTPARDADPTAPSSNVFRDRERGVSIDVPSGWTVAAQNLTPYLGVPDLPGEIVSLGTYPLHFTDAGCAQFPTQALDDLGPSDAFITVTQSVTYGPAELASIPERPSSFAPTKTNAVPATSDLFECLSPARPMSVWSFGFQADDRAFNVLLAIGEHTTDAQRAEAWRTVNSLVIQHPADAAR